MNPLSLIPAPYRLIATIGLVVAFTAGVYAMGYTKGNKHATDACSAEKLAAVTRAVEQAQAIAKEDAKISEETAKTTEVIRWRTRDRIIKDRTYATAKPLPAECVLDDDRLRNINDALSGKPTDSGKLNYTLPPATKIGGQEN